MDLAIEFECPICGTEHDAGTDECSECGADFTCPECCEPHDDMGLCQDCAEYFESGPGLLAEG